MRPRVLLVKPFGVADEIIPPVSLGLLATQLRQSCEVEILDALKEGCQAEAVAQRALAGGFHLVGFQVWSKDLPETRQTCSLIKQGNPAVITMVGGIHPTMLPVETIAYYGDCLDFAFKGEGELSLPRLLELVAAGDLSADALRQIPGLVWREGGETVVNDNQFLTDLDSLGFPAWDLMPPASYPEAPHGAIFRNFPIAPIIASRGCPYPCTFCAARAASGARLRRRSVPHLIAELRLLHDQFGVREFQIEDDNFTHSADYVVEFCEQLLAQDFAMTWSFPNGVRLDKIDRPLLQLMRRAGCYALNFGIESGSQRILDMIRKNTTLEQIRQQLTLAHEEGMEMGCFFIVGSPTETVAEIEATIRFACSLPLDRVAVSYFQPFPGTPLFHQLVEAGEIPRTWADDTHTSLHNLTYVTPSLTAADLQRLRRKLLRRFYFRPQTVLTMLRQVRSLAHLRYMLQRSRRWLSA